MSLEPHDGPSDAIVVANPGLGADGRHPLVDLAGRRIPWFDAWCTTHLCRGLHLGATDDDSALSRPERSIMILGPPRDTGTTTAVLVPLVRSAYAPVVAGLHRRRPLRRHRLGAGPAGPAVALRPRRGGGHPGRLPPAALVTGVGRGGLGHRGQHRRGDDRHHGPDPGHPRHERGRLLVDSGRLDPGPPAARGGTGRPGYAHRD